MAEQEPDWNRWRRLETLKNLLNRSSPLVPPTFVPGIDNLLALVEDKKVLVVGAGGLGCEILKDLALSGFSTIEVVDIDTIDLSNLNRQFLFRQKDIGRAKADVAAESIMKRCPWMKITPHTRKIQEFPPSFFEEFDIIIAGLDNVEARRWLNSTLVNLVELDEDGNVLTETVRPLIDGGTEGFKGQARLFFPMMTSCYECSIGTLPVPKAVPLCTIANVPRTPEHCIAYALEAEWPKLRSLKSCNEYELGESEDESSALQLDTDNVMHMQWIFRRAFDRASKFGIEGVTYSMTMKVVKNIVPSIASTNAIISAICVNEALKVCTWSSMPLSNFLMYIGSHGVYSRTFQYERNENCIVCGSKKILYKIDRTMTLQALIDKMKSDPLLYVYHHSRPLSRILSLQASFAVINVVTLENVYRCRFFYQSDISYHIHPPKTDERVLFLPSQALRDIYASNLTEQMQHLLASETDVIVRDASLGSRHVTLRIVFLPHVSTRDVEMRNCTKRVRESSLDDYDDVIE